jgi:hypothetical protein
LWKRLTSVCQPAILSSKHLAASDFDFESESESESEHLIA